MKCTDFEQLVHEYVDGELTDSVALIEEHIESCATCKALYEETLELKMLLNDLDDIDLPDDFEATLHDKLIEETKDIKVKPLKRWQNTIKILGSVAALAVVSIIVYQSLPRMGSEDAANFAGVPMAMDDTATLKSADMEMAEAVTEETVEEEAGTVTMTFDAAVENDMTSMDRSYEAKAYTARLTPYVLTENKREYVLKASEDIVIELVEDYEVKDFEVLYNQYRFFIHLDDLESFDETLRLSSAIQVLDMYETNHSHEIVYLRQEMEMVTRRIEELNNEYETADADQKTSLEAQIEAENKVLESYQLTFDNIEAYKEYQQIIIIMSEE